MLTKERDTTSHKPKCECQADLFTCLWINGRRISGASASLLCGDDIEWMISRPSRVARMCASQWLLSPVGRVGYTWMPTAAKSFEAMGAVIVLDGVVC